MSYKLPTIDQVTFTVEALPEDCPVRGAFATDEPELDRADENSILAELESGNVWAWCCVHVRAQYRGFTGDDYLGCCSYESEANFIEANDYFDDMKHEAFGALIASMRNAAERLGCTP